MQTWRRFWRMSVSARGHLLEAAAGLVITRVCLHLLGFQRWNAVIEWLTREAARAGGSASQPQLEFARALERWEAAAARNLPLETNCLDRAMTLWWLLRKRGIEAEMHIGARSKNGKFEAHAWVEAGGAVLDGTSDGSEFAKFQRPAAAMRTQAS